MCESQAHCTMRRRSFALASLGLIAPLKVGMSPAVAERFPTRSIAAIVPWPERGVVDVITRAVTTNVSRKWGVPIDVVNKIGKDGAIGTDAVATSAPDGYTWLIGTLTTLTAPYVVKGIYSSPLQHFSGAAMLAASSLVAVVPSALPVNSLKEFVAWAKGRGKLQYLNPGTGSASYLNTELLGQKERLDLEAVNYNGQPIGIPDLVLGHLQFGLIAPGLAKVLIGEGRLRPLAVAFPRRVPQFAGIPTVAEAGFPEMDVVASYYILVPKRTPVAVARQISAAVNEATSDPGVRAKIEATGGAVLATKTPDEVDAYLVSQDNRWTQFFKAHQIAPE